MSPQSCELIQSGWSITWCKIPSTINQSDHCFDNFLLGSNYCRCHIRHSTVLQSIIWDDPVRKKGFQAKVCLLQLESQPKHGRGILGQMTSSETEVSYSNDTYTLPIRGLGRCHKRVQVHNCSLPKVTAKWPWWVLWLQSEILTFHGD